MINILRLIREEIENWFADEPSLTDNTYNKFGITSTDTINSKPSGEFIGNGIDNYTKKSVGIYKNPNNLNGFRKSVRGVLTSDGNLYLSESPTITHDEILDILQKKGIISYASKYDYSKNYPEEFVAVVRAIDMDQFGISSAYNEFPIYYDAIFDLANRVQPYNFIAPRTNDI